MNRLLFILIIINLILFGWFLSLDKEWDHVVSTKEHTALMIKHGVKYTQVVMIEGGKAYYFKQGKRARFQ